MLCEENAANWWRSDEWLLHHDSAAAHTALSVRQFLTTKRDDNGFAPPYTPAIFSFFQE